jgi:hypothetical protein
MFSANPLAYLSMFSGIFPVVAALFNYRYLDKALKIAVAYFLASVLSDLLQQILKSEGIVNNWPVIHVYILVSILLLGAMYYHAFFSPLLKKITIVITVLVFAVFIANIILIDGLTDYPSLSNTILSMALICFSLVYFYQLLNRQEFVHIEKQGLFWINAGILIYFAINIFSFMLFKRMLKEHQEGLYMINNITNIIANILFTVGLLCKPQKKATSSRY